VGIIALGGSTAQAAPPLVGQWPLDSSSVSGADDVTADISGNGLTLSAPAGSVDLGPPSIFGAGATQATNVTPMKVTSPATAPAELTLLAWIRQSGNPGTLRYIAGRGDDGSPTCGGSTYALYTGYPGMPGLRFYVRTGPSGTSALTAAPADSAVFDGNWHLVAGTYDGAVARLYVDGTLVGSPVSAPAPLTYALGGSDSFYVDGYSVEACALFGNADDFPGGIDEVRLYDRALSATELGRLATATGPTAPDLVPDATTPPPDPVPVAQLLGGARMTAAMQSVSGAAAKAPRGALAKALAEAQQASLGAMLTSPSASEVAARAPVKGLSQKEEARVQANEKIQARLEAMKYGIAVEVPKTSAGQVVEVAATLALMLEGKQGPTTQTIVLPPSAGIAGSSPTIPVQIPVDPRASRALESQRVASAAISIQAVEIGSVSEVGELEFVRLQSAMEQLNQSLVLISNLLNKVAEAERNVIKNIRDGDKGDVKKAEQQVEAAQKKAVKVEKAAAAASQQASESMQAAAGSAISGSVPSPASAALRGCAKCKYAAIRKSKPSP
jgi:hypothetical protein